MRDALPEPVRRRLDPDARYGLRLTLFAVALVLVAVPFALLVDQVVRNGPLTRADSVVAEGFHDRARNSLGLVRALRVMTVLGSPAWLAMVVGITALHAGQRRRWRLALFLVATMALGGAVNAAVKAAVDRERPSLRPAVASAGGPSFPSGHAMSSTVAYGAVLLVMLPAVPRRARRPVVAATVLLVGAIGASRVALGVHYVSDVVAGHVLGAAWLSASTAAFSVWRVERGRAPVAPLDGLEPEAAAELRA